MVGIGDMISNANFGIFGEDSTNISAITGIVDIYQEENHNLTVTKTKYPVESGSSMTDNFVIEPESLVLKGLVSDLQPFADGLVSMPNENRAKEAWGRLKELKNSGELVTVVTLLGTYENMLVIGIDAVMNQGTGKALFFTITLEETQIAETEIVKLAPVKLSESAATKGTDTDGGKKQSETPEEGERTILQSIVSGVGGLL